MTGKIHKCIKNKIAFMKIVVRRLLIFSSVFGILSHMSDRPSTRGLGAAFSQIDNESALIIAEEMDEMKKKQVIVSMMSVATVGLAACGGSGEKADQKDQFSVAMVADKGGIDDKSFNQSAWEGLQAYGKDNKLQKNEGFSYLQSKSQQDYQPNLSRLARGGEDLVFGIGNTFNEDIKTVADQFKDTQFAIIDNVVEGKNVTSITFKENEGAYLAGIVAAMETKKDHIGFVGGMKMDVIERFRAGFEAGAKSVNPKIKIDVQYAEDFAAPEKGQAIAAGMYGKGADIIFPAAGGTGNGVFTEAKNRKKNGENVSVIGVDRDQKEEGMPEDVTLTSVIKRVDRAVEDTANAAKDGKLEGGKTIRYGLKEDGVDIVPSEKISKKTLTALEKAKSDVVSGKIEVPEQ